MSVAIDLGALIHNFSPELKREVRDLEKPRFAQDLHSIRERQRFTSYFCSKSKKSQFGVATRQD